MLSISPENPIAKLVLEHKMGMVSAPGDIDTWVKNAHTLYLNQYNNQQMGINARAFAEEHFNIDRVANEFEALMQAGR